MFSKLIGMLISTLMKINAMSGVELLPKQLDRTVRQRRPMYGFSSFSVMIEQSWGIDLHFQTNGKAASPPNWW